MHLADDDRRTLIDELLDTQKRLTAVERFAQRHDGDVRPAQARYYRDLIPQTLPQPGQQYAFEVDLDRCSGCKACVSACHSLNGLDENESWREIGLLVSDDWRQPFQQTVTTACHHCVDPGCLSGCPVLAYDKDPITGIVRHLDDQCIGCQYCVMKCPYDVPKYSASRGIVRKCDLCTNRLAVGEAPACAQACPSEAIRITLVDTRTIESVYRNSGGRSKTVPTEPAAISDVQSRLAVPVNAFLPSAPDPGWTLPTTRYKSARALPAGLRAGDHARVKPAELHLPLVFMLVLTQLSVGTSVAAIVAPSPRWLAVVTATVAAFALGIASLHLGKPLKAWRAFLGWRTSWFSREVIVFGGFVPLAALGAAAFWFAPLASFQRSLALATAATGLLGVCCSAMIYVDTRREYWRSSQCFTRFLGTTVLLGAASALAVSALTRPIQSAALAQWAALVFAVSGVKLGWEQRIFRHLVHEESAILTPMNRTARLLADPLGRCVRLRVLTGVLGGLVLPALLVLGGGGAGLALAALALCLVGELLERCLFFAAVAPSRMPGAAAT